MFEKPDEGIEEVTPEAALNTIMERIRNEGGIQGSGRRYSYEDIESRVKEVLEGDNPQLETITSAGGLREAVRAVFLEKTKKRVEAEKTGGFSPEAEELERLGEVDRSRSWGNFFDRKK